jgi:phosphoribosyl-ATP pyrophosphohydrolase
VKTVKKLVRSKVPQLSRASLPAPYIRLIGTERVEGAPLVSALCAKLVEEAREVEEAWDTAKDMTPELVDVATALFALMRVKGVLWSDVQDKMMARVSSHGDFAQKFSDGFVGVTAEFEVEAKNEISVNRCAYVEEGR